MSGFRRHRAAIDSVLDLITSVEDAKVRKKTVLAAFLDVRRAYDTVSHASVLHGLVDAALPFRALSWLTDFLHGRELFVRTSQGDTDFVKLTHGVPQGSVLSPILFNIVMAGLRGCVGRKVAISIYADDICIWTTGKSCPALQRRLQLALDAIQQYLSLAGLDISTEKTVVIPFTRRNMRPFQLSVAGIPLKHVSHHRFLGLTVDARLSWRRHIASLEIKIHRWIAVIRRLAGMRWGSDTSSLLAVHRALVRGSLVYSLPVLNGLPTSSDHKLQCLLARSLPKAILSTLNPDRDPCEDFYEFVCTGWKKDNPLNGAPANSVILKTTVAVFEDLRGLLKKNILEHDIFWNVRESYRSCTNKRVWPEEEAYAFQSILKRAGISSWPLWPPTEEGSDWQHLYRSSRIGLNLDDLETLEQVNLFHLFITRDLRSPTKHAAFLFLSPRETEEIQAAFPSTKVDVKGAIQTLNKTISEEEAEAAAEEIIGFETGLSMLFGTAERQKRDNELLESSKDDAVSHNDLIAILKSKTRIGVTHFSAKVHKKLRQMYQDGDVAPVSIKQLQGILPQVQWASFLNSIFSEANITVHDDEEIFYVAVAQFERLLSYLASHKRSTIQNYFGWRIVVSFKEFASRSLNLTADRLPRWIACIMDLSTQASMILARLYVDHFFTPQDREQLRSLVQGVRKAVRVMIEDASWLDDSTRKKALENVDKMVAKVGYPDWLKNNTHLKQLYNKVGWVSKHTPYSVIRARYLNNDAVHDLKKIRRAFDRNEGYPMPLVTTNAAHILKENAIEITPAIARGLLYEEGLPVSVNFGAIGFTIGHEITHGYDTLGREYDATGIPVNWWSPETDAEYKKKAQCFVDMYNNITDPTTGFKLNGENTVAENIADNGGVNAAFKAYREKIKDAGKLEDDALPGLTHLSGDQLFFISQALAWCGSTTKEHFASQLANDPHSPEKYRVNPPLANMKEFADAFQCDANSPMVQKHKCLLW
ncbi:membrane metallo-endopeptidase-like 1 [Ornithodoros turicata]|uniref:membrane metallo-endopeptidase-like 1 n=1 Tax=Ornithodoros turicata TaxID=34597 RepID=UPI0031389091